MKELLVVIDMQNDFVTGSLGTKEACAITEKVRQKILSWTAEGGEVVFTRDTHGENYLDTPEGKKLPVKHCIKGTDGWQIVPGLETGNCEYIDKPTFGWMNWNGLDEKDELELIGVCTDICVVSKALILKAKDPEALFSIRVSFPERFIRYIYNRGCFGQRSRSLPFAKNCYIPAYSFGGYMLYYLALCKLPDLPVSK